jgi:hypothetical protein
MSAAVAVTTITTMNNNTSRIIRFLVGNWPARIYLVLVAAAALFMVWSLATLEHPAASFSGIYLLLLTSPCSWLLVLLMVGDGPSWINAVIYFGGTAICAIVNTAVISVTYSLLTRGSPWPARSPG